ncbi:MAG TPA: TM1802 family CRISPR-associated protein [Fervidobacterium sp.]|nr:TM1802 family CRISPR-associated protein [Fervidobacterium sp.]
MTRHTEFLDNFSDKFLQTDFGRGVLLAGVVLGHVAHAQVRKSGEGNSAGKIQDAPLYKQLNFGKLELRDLKRHLARIPEFIKAYRIDPSFLLEDLTAYSQELILKAGNSNLGVDGNFAFVAGFMNSNKYFYEIYKDHMKGKVNEENQEEVNEESQEDMGVSTDEE